MATATLTRPTGPIESGSRYPNQQPALWVLLDDADARASYGKLPVPGHLPGPMPDSETVYRTQIAGYPLLSPAREQRLARAMRAGDAHAREQLFLCNLRLVWKLAFWYATAKAPLLDVAQVGNLTLWQKMAMYDPDRLGPGGQPYKFSTFITHHIMQAMRRASDDMSNLIREPVHAADHRRRIYRLADQYELETGQLPSDDLIAAAMDVPVHVARARKERATTMPRVHSIEAMVERGNNPHSLRSHGTGRIDDAIPADALFAYAAGEGAMAPSAEEMAMADAEDGARAELMHELTELVRRKCTPKEQQVIGLRFGHGLKQSQCADLMGVSRQRVEQLEKLAIRKLRQADNATGAFRRLAQDYAE